MEGQIRRHIARLLLSYKKHTRYVGILACVAVVVALGVTSILSREGITMSTPQTVLDCQYSGDGAHTHTQDCYDADGNLVCPLPEKSLHTHDDSCYTETSVLACGQVETPAHAHDESCYDEEGNLTCGQEETPGHTHTDECYAVSRQLTCGMEEVTEEHVHGPGCFTTVMVDDGQDENEPEPEAEVEAGTTVVTDDGEQVAAGTTHKAVENATEDEADPMPAQEFSGTLKQLDEQGNEQVYLVVSVKAPKGALPKGTTMKLDHLKTQTPEQVEALTKMVEDAVNAESQTTTYELEQMTGADIAFVDATGKSIEPAVKVEVKISAALVQEAEAPVLVHVVDKEKAIKQYAEAGQTVTADELVDAMLIKDDVHKVNQFDDDTTTGNENTLWFETTEFTTPYVVAQMKEVVPEEEQTDENADAEDENTDETADGEDEQTDETVEGEEGTEPEEGTETEDGAETEDGTEAEAEADNADKQPNPDNLITADEGEPEGETDGEAEGEGATEDEADAAAAYPAQTFSHTFTDKDGAELLSLAVDAPEGALPEGATMKAEWVKAADVREAVEGAVAAKAEADQTAAKEVTAIQAVDITFYDKDDNPIEPQAKITVTLASDRIAKSAEEENSESLIVHVPDEGDAEVVDALGSKELEKRELEDASNELVFDSDQFSIYAIAYTVDFHYEVDGQTYTMSFDGGDTISLRELLRGLKVVEEESLDKVLAGVVSVKFSDESLLAAAKVEEDTTAGALKSKLELQPIYSCTLTEEQIARMDDKQLAKGDWALIALKPFDTDEMLTVTMDNGDTFRIATTDDRFETTVLTADGKTFVITVEYGDEAEIPAGSKLEAREIEKKEDDYKKYLAESAEKIGVATDDVSSAHFFDIQIVHDGEKVEPKAPVKVSIKQQEALGMQLGEMLKVVHFADEGTEVISDVALSKDQKAITYEQESFSVTGTIVSAPSGGSDLQHPNTYALVVKYEGNFYSVDSDGTLRPCAVDNPDDPSTVVVGSPMMWSYDTDGNIYHHTEATDVNGGQVACDFYYKFIDINDPDAIYEEAQIKNKPEAGQYSQPVENNDVKLESQYIQYNGANKWCWMATQHKHKASSTVHYDSSTHKLTNNTDTRVLDVELNEQGLLHLVSKPANESSGVEFYFTDVQASVPGVSPYNHTISHIDISIDGSADVAVPLAYGTYYRKDGDNYVEYLKIENGVYYVKSGNSWVEALDSNGNPHTDANPIKVHKDLSINDQDIKSATITATDASGNPIDNAFYVSGYSANSPSAGENWQVRIEGSFKVADLQPVNGYDPNTTSIMEQRLNNRIYYSVSTVKRDEPLTVSYNGVQLYDNHNQPMEVTADITVTSSPVDYWDQGNHCPPLVWWPNWWSNNHQVSWQEGGIYTGNDPRDSSQWFSGIDYQLAGDKVTSKAEIHGMEITKYILDTNGDVIKTNSTIVTDFKVYEKTSDVEGYNTDDVLRLNGGEAAINPRGDQESGTLPEYGAYHAPDDSLYDGYTEHTEYEMLVTVGTNGRGLQHNYNVTEGMYYIVENPESVPKTITSQDGTTYRYVQTHLESEYARRMDEYISQKYGGPYVEPVHVSPIYTRLDGDNAQTYRAIPEVLGNFKEANGSSVRADGTAVRNAFLEFYVYNVYVPDTKLDVEKKWVNTEAPDGAEVTVDLYYAKRMVASGDGNAVDPIADWPEKDAYLLASDAKWDGTQTPIFESSMVKQLTLSANSTPDAWKGTFQNLPQKLLDANGNIWEFDYYAKESAVTVDGENIMSEYDVVAKKTEPAEEDAYTSDGKVDIINSKGSLNLEKKWLLPDGVTEFTPDSSSATITAELWRRGTEGGEQTVTENMATVTIYAQDIYPTDTYNNGQPVLMWTGQVVEGSDLYFSVAANETSNPTSTVNPKGGYSTNNGSTVEGPLPDRKPDIDYLKPGSTTELTGITKNQTNVFLLSDVQDGTIITAKFGAKRNSNNQEVHAVKTDNSDTAGFGYRIVELNDQPQTTTITTDPADPEPVNIPGRVENGVVTLNQENGWKFSLLSGEMEPGWEYYFKEDTFHESGVSADEYQYVAPTKSSDDEGNVTYTAKNIAKGVDLDVEKIWSPALSNTDNSNAEVVVELLYSIKPADDSSAEWSEYANVGDQMGANGLFAHYSIPATSLTLKADADSDLNWRGTFEKLPTTVRGTDGTLYEVRYSAAETKVIVNGVETTKYTVTTAKTDPANASTSAGKVTLTNTNEKVQVTAKKVWDPTPTDTNASATVVLHRYAKKTKGTISVTLKDDRGIPIKGAVYTLFENGTATQTTVTTDVNGNAQVTGLGAGTYKLVQTSTPEDYSMEGAGCITETGELTVVNNTTTPQQLHSDNINIVNIMADTVTLLVTNSYNNAPIVGAVFDLYNVDGLVSSGYATNDEGKIVTSIQDAGTYYFQQVSTPSDYIMPNNPRTDSFTIHEPSTHPQSIVLAKQNVCKGEGVVVLTLKDNNGEPLSGGQFHLVGNGLTIDGVTDENGQITFDNNGEKLPVGDYTITQTAELDGLKPAGAQVVRILENGDPNQTVPCEVTNVYRGKGTVVITLTKKEDGTPINGARFELRGAGQTVPGTTDSNGKIVFTNVPEGNWTIHQVNTGDAGTRYKTAADQTFSIVEGDNAQTINKAFENEEDAGNVTVNLYRAQGWTTPQGLTNVITYFDRRVELKAGSELHITIGRVQPGHTFAYSFDVNASNRWGTWTAIADNDPKWVNNTYDLVFNIPATPDEATYNIAVATAWSIDTNTAHFNDALNANASGTNSTNAMSNMLMMAVSSARQIAAAAPTATPTNTVDVGAADATAIKAAPKAGNAPALRSVNVTDASPVEPPADYMEDASFNPQTGVLDRNGNWQHVFDPEDKYDDDGNPYIYYIVETAHTPEDYWIESYSGTVSDVESGDITVKNTTRGQLSVQKTFSGNAAGDLTAEQKLTLQFRIQGTGGITYDETFSYGVDDADKNATWNGDVLTITDLMPGTYNVTESGDTFVDGDNVPYIHTSTMTVNGSAATSVDATRDGQTMVIDNKYEKAKLDITKTVTGLPESGTTATFTFTVTGEGLGSGKTVTLNYPADFTDGSGTVTLTQADGIRPGETYTVTETVSGANVTGYTRTTTIASTEYTQASVTAPSGDATVDATSGEGSITVTNNYVQDTVDIPVDKAWAFANGSTEWPSGVEVSVQLYSKVGDDKPAPVAGKTVTLTSAQTSQTFEDLPEYDGENRIDYSVVEAGVTGVDAERFTTTVSGDAAAGFHITNTEKAAGLTIVKTFSGATLTDAEKNLLTFTVTGDGLKDRTTGEAVESLSKTYAEFTNGTWVLTQDDGIVGGHTYTVTETNANVDKYTRVSTVTVNGDSATATTFEQTTTPEDEGNTPTGTVAIDGNTGVGTVTIDNAYAKEKTEVTGTKTWVDKREHNNASEIVLTLKRTTVAEPNDSDWETVTVAAPITFAWVGNSYTFANLDKYDDSEQLYTYKVEETSVNVTDGGTVVSYQQVADGNNFTNTELVNLEATKTWKDGEQDITSTLTNASVTFELQRKNGENWVAVAQDGITNPQILSVTDTASAAAWKATWNNLPKYETVDVEGTPTVQEIEYRVVETAASVLTQNVKPADDPTQLYDDATSANIENTLPKTQIDVTKQWNDADDTEHVFDEAKTIEFTVHQKYGNKDVVYTAYGTEGKGTVTYTPASGQEQGAWSVEHVENLPKFVYDTTDQKWYEASYYVVEDAIDGVTTTYQLGEGEAAATSPEVGNSSEDRDITIVNKDKALALDLVKVDVNDPSKKLDGAAFVLHKLDADDATKIAYESETDVLPTTSGADHKTGTDGKATFANLVAGYYEIKETTAPGGYNLSDEGTFYIKVDSGSIVQLIPEEGKAPKDWAVKPQADYTDEDLVHLTATLTNDTATATVGNVKGKELPESGGRPGISLTYLLWSFVIAAVLGVLVSEVMRRREVALHGISSE